MSRAVGMHVHVGRKWRVSKKEHQRSTDCEASFDGGSLSSPCMTTHAFASQVPTRSLFNTPFVEHTYFLNFFS